MTLGLLLWAVTQSAPAGDAEYASSLAGSAKYTVDTFLRDSFGPRIEYEYHDGLAHDTDRENLRELAANACERLSAVAEKQKQLKQQIEDYSGDDWEIKYGATGLWRKLSADICTTLLYKFQIDYFLALTYDHPQKNDALRNILVEIQALKAASLPPETRLLKARILSQFARTAPVYQPMAVKQLDQFGLSSNITTHIQAATEKIKLLGCGEPQQIKTLIGLLEQNGLDTDLELLLPLVLIQRRCDSQGFEQTVKTFPQLQPLLGRLLLADLAGQDFQQQDPGQPGVFEAELAVQVIWEKGPHDYKAVLEQLSSTAKFQTPLILYVAGMAFAESAPAAASELLVKASNLQKLKKSPMLNIPAEKIAQQAAALAYNLFIEDSNNCSRTIEVFDNYITKAAGAIDEKLEYLYAAMLYSCGRQQQATELLQKIAERPSGLYRSQAKLLLTVLSIRREQDLSTDRKVTLLSQLGELITDANDCRHTGEIMHLLPEVIDQIDIFHKHPLQFSAALLACKKLARVCYNCLDGPEKIQAGLYLAEASILVAENDNQQLAPVEELCNTLTESTYADSVDLMRCRARLLTSQGNFEKACQLWAQLARLHNNPSPTPAQQSWKWWRAKFYQIYCWSKLPETESRQVIHTIEVLENSFRNIPSLWAEKLKELKTTLTN
ncbi:MAG TPA: hypothetical protein VMW23_01930 [Sedimentisphaerales bacterium]|nr:hypothetical protein [Sedimentisphaerales bacterium]